MSLLHALSNYIIQSIAFYASLQILLSYIILEEYYIIDRWITCKSDWETRDSQNLSRRRRGCCICLCLFLIRHELTSYWITSSDGILVEFNCRPSKAENARNRKLQCRTSLRIWLGGPACRSGKNCTTISSIPVRLECSGPTSWVKDLKNTLASHFFTLLLLQAITFIESKDGRQDHTSLHILPNQTVGDQEKILLNAYNAQDKQGLCLWLTSIIRQVVNIACCKESVWELTAIVLTSCKWALLFWSFMCRATSKLGGKSIRSAPWLS